MKFYIEKIFTIGSVFWILSIAVLLFLAIPGFVWAQVPHPIDQSTDNCIAKDSSTIGMVNCLDLAYGQWDNELNYVYQALRGQLSPQARDVLKTSQRAWIAYRDAEFNTIDMIYGSLDGSMWRLAALSGKVDMVRNRTLELHGYLESLRQGR